MERVKRSVSGRLAEGQAPEKAREEATEESEESRGEEGKRATQVETKEKEHRPQLTA